VTTVDELLARSEAMMRQLEQRGVSGGRRQSRYAGAGADPDYVKQLAAGEHGGSVDRGGPASHRPGGTGDRRGGLVALMRKALAEGTPGSGGYMVPIEYAAGVLELIRARSAVMRMGVTTVQVKKEMDITSMASGATAGYVAENALIPTSEETFSQAVLLRPKQLAALVPVSNILLRDADNPSVDQVVQQDVAEVMALRQDLAFIAGTGTGSEPLGIVNKPGITAGPSMGATGRTPTFDDLKAIVATLRAKNARFLSPGWLFHPRLLSTLETIKLTTGDYLADTDLLTYDTTGAGGTLLGYRFATSTQINTAVTLGASTDTTSVIFSSDWNECWVGENEGLTIDVSSEASYTPDGGVSWVSSFQANQTLFRATMRHDIALRRPEMVVVTAGVRP
jgi:HK97 family phage major capsid protein